MAEEVALAALRGLVLADRRRESVQTHLRRARRPVHRFGSRFSGISVVGSSCISTPFLSFLT